MTQSRRPALKRLEEIRAEVKALDDWSCSDHIKAIARDMWTEIEVLREENLNLREWEQRWSKRQKRLEQENEVLRDGLQFYADPLTWMGNSGKNGVSLIVDDQGEMPRGPTGISYWCGGIKARELFAAADKIRGGG